MDEKDTLFDISVAIILTVTLLMFVLICAHLMKEQLINCITPEQFKAWVESCNQTQNCNIENWMV